MPAQYSFGRFDWTVCFRRVTAALAVFVISTLASHAADSPPTGVLILHSNQRPTPAAIAIEETLRRVVPAGYPGPVELYSEYLDDEWATGRDYGNLQSEFLK